MASMESLPIEVQAIILGYVPYREYHRHLVRVCKRWRRIVNEAVVKAENLDLSSCALQIEPAVKWLVKRGPFLRLQSLSLAHCINLSPQLLSTLLSLTPGLTRLDLSSSNATPVPLPTTLRDIDLSKSLYATRARIHLRELPQSLLSLTFSEAHCPSVLPELLQLTALTSLRIPRAQGIDECVQSLSSFKCLKSLDISETDCTSASLPQLPALLPNLRALKVAYLPVTDDTLRSFSTLSGLQVLSLEEADAVTDKGIEAIAASCPSLCSLNLEGCWRLTSAALTHLSLCRHLTYLSLLSCQSISEVAVADFKKELPKCFVRQC